MRLLGTTSTRTFYVGFSLFFMVAPLHARVGEEPRAPSGTGECANCSEGQWYGRAAHWWHGSEGCLPGGEGCSNCESEYCNDSSVPHGGPCPGACDQVALLDLFPLGEEGGLDVMARGMETLEYDPGAGRVSALDCGGNVVLWMALPETSRVPNGQAPTVGLDE